MYPSQYIYIYIYIYTHLYIYPLNYRQLSDQGCLGTSQKMSCVSGDAHAELDGLRLRRIHDDLVLNVDIAALQPGSASPNKHSNSLRPRF